MSPYSNFDIVTMLIILLIILSVSLLVIGIVLWIWNKHPKWEPIPQKPAQIIWDDAGVWCRLGECSHPKPVEVELQSGRDE